MLDAGMSEIADAVERFLVTEVRSGHRVDSIAPDDDLIGRGILDSLGIQQLVAFLESRYGLRIADEDIVPDNFQSLRRVETFVTAQMSRAPARAPKRRRGRWG
jgi:acyl carrier protein